jgi:hypothetical protein
VAAPSTRQASDEHLTPPDLARRASRFTYASRRIQKIVTGWPPLTAEQLAALAALLQPGGES